MIGKRLYRQNFILNNRHNPVGDMGRHPWGNRIYNDCNNHAQSATYFSNPRFCNIVAFSEKVKKNE